MERAAAFGVDGISTSFVWASATDGLESCEVIVTSDALSSSAAMVDEEPQLNAGSSMGTVISSAAAVLPVSAGSDVGTSLPHALRQVFTVEGHPTFGTKSLVKVKSQ